MVCVLTIVIQGFTQEEFKDDASLWESGYNTGWCFCFPHFSATYSNTPSHALGRDGVVYLEPGHITGSVPTCGTGPCLGLPDLFYGYLVVAAGLQRYGCAGFYSVGRCAAGWYDLDL